MATEVCFVNGATLGIGPQIGQGRLAEGNQFAAIDRKSVSKPLRLSDNLQPITPELAHRGQVEMAALLPSIAVVFAVAGPVVYETRTPSVRATGEKTILPRFRADDELRAGSDGYRAMNEREAFKVTMKA